MDFWPVLGRKWAFEAGLGVVLRKIGPERVGGFLSDFGAFLGSLKNRTTFTAISFGKKLTEVAKMAKLIAISFKFGF